VESNRVLEFQEAIMNLLARETRSRLRELFFDAIEGRIAKPWEAGIRKRCGDDLNLAQQVLDLLRYHDLPDSDFLKLLPGFLATYPWEETQCPESGAILAGKYLVTGFAAEGGLGLVFQVQSLWDPWRMLALKLTNPAKGNDDREDRLIREGQLLARLNHPHIVKILDSGVAHKHRKYLVMEWVDGDQLRDHCVKETLGLEGTIQCFEQLLSAVHHCHQQGILHLDLKPENVLVESTPSGPRVKVIDFGAALTMRQIQGKSGVLPGLNWFAETSRATRGLAAQEFDQLDPRSDIFALGKILGDLLWDLEIREKRRFHLRNAFPRLTSDREIHEGWIEIVVKATSDQKKDRFPSVEMMAKAVRDQWNRSKQPLRKEWRIFCYFLLAVGLCSFLPIVFFLIFLNYNE